MSHTFRRSTLIHSAAALFIRLNHLGICRCNKKVGQLTRSPLGGSRVVLAQLTTTMAEAMNKKYNQLLEDASQAGQVDH